MKKTSVKNKPMYELGDEIQVIHCRQVCYGTIVAISQRSPHWIRNPMSYDYMVDLEAKSMTHKLFKILRMPSWEVYGEFEINPITN